MLTITGVIKGTKTENKKNRDGADFQVHHVGIEVNKTGGYEGETVIYDLAVSRDQVGSGVLATYQKHVGQAVSVPIWLTSWVSAKGNSGINYHLSGNGNPQIIKS